MNLHSSMLRDYSLDNVRFVLILSVVFAHLLEVCTPFKGSGMIYKFIYSFHMPAFIFLFGYNAKFALRKLVYRWIIPYVIFQCAYILFVRVILNINIEFQFTTPYWLLWYMLVCIYYQLLLPLFDKYDKNRKLFIVFCAFVISLFIGYVKAFGYFMSLSRFFVFLPWFLLGYYSKENNLFECLSFKPQKQFWVLIASMLLIAVFIPFVRTIPNQLLYGSYSYASCGGTLWMRGMVWVMSFVSILFLFVGMRLYFNRKLMLITTIGQNTWPIFLLHGFVIKAAPVYFPRLVSSPWRVLLLAFVICMLAGNKLCKKAVYYACFSWLERYSTKNTYKERAGSA